ncbi:hypothetical protein COV20_06160 [Candidatus Woesearchaeota archaeon CG10_big_fil_rev_8_21_14_0_10_45_16]|nr:MAG: hypothetical protein COV20_06160 [Candidatus Woesearchaeota archaeon CG10_big_fil_rev_8_21_14_0_10_45_16]
METQEAPKRIEGRRLELLAEFDIPRDRAMDVPGVLEGYFGLQSLPGNGSVFYRSGTDIMVTRYDAESVHYLVHGRHGDSDASQIIQALGDLGGHPRYSKADDTVDFPYVSVVPPITGDEDTIDRPIGEEDTVDLAPEDRPF